MVMIRVLLAAFCLAWPLHLPDALAQAPWPTRPIRVVVPFAPGGTTDIITRILADDLAGRLGQPVVVENRSGANGTIAGNFVAHAAPDGTTFLMGSNGTNVITTFFMKDIPYAPRRDFRNVAMVAQYAQALVVNAAIPVTTVAEFVAYAKARDGQLNYASTGNGARMAMEMFMQRSGIRMAMVTYRGSGPALQDLIRGDVQATFDLQSSTLPAVQTGQLRVLGISTAARNPRTPDVPTLQEAGFTNFEMVSWQGIFAPRGTPDAIVAALNAAVNASLRRPDVETRIRDIGAAPFPLSPTHMDAYIAREFETLGAVAHAAGIQPE